MSSMTTDPSWTLAVAGRRTDVHRPGPAAPRQTLIAAVLALAAGTAYANERTPPAPQCIDARALQSVRPINEQAILVATSTRFAQIDLAPGCAAPASAGELLSPSGWVCGSERELLRVAGRSCKVMGVTTIDARTFATMARALDNAAQRDTLDTIEVLGRRRGSGFRGSFEYCLRPSFMRAWSENANGVRVVTSAKRHQGYTAYQVEFAASCPETTLSESMQLLSPFGNDLICGHPGETASFSSPSRMSPSGAVIRPCPIARVYPVD